MQKVDLQKVRAEFLAFEAEWKSKPPQERFPKRHDLFDGPKIIALLESRPTVMEADATVDYLFRICKTLETHTEGYPVRYAVQELHNVWRYHVEPDPAILKKLEKPPQWKGRYETIRYLLAGIDFVLARHNTPSLLPSAINLTGGSDSLEKHIRSENTLLFKSLASSRALRVVLPLDHSPVSDVHRYYPKMPLNLNTKIHEIQNQELFARAGYVQGCDRLETQDRFESFKILIDWTNKLWKNETDPKKIERFQDQIGLAFISATSGGYVNAMRYIKVKMPQFDIDREIVLVGLIEGRSSMNAMDYAAKHRPDMVPELYQLDAKDTKFAKTVRAKARPCGLIAGL